MEQNKTYFDWKTFALVFIAGLLVLSYFRISALSGKVDSLITENSGLRADIQVLHNSINSVYANIEQQLKEQGSLISGVDYSLGDLGEDMKTVELSVTVVPKAITEDMVLALTVDGVTAPLERQGSVFIGTIAVGLFVDYDQLPLLSIRSAEGTKTEYLDDIDISYLFSRHLPSLHVDRNSYDGEFEKGRLSVNMDFSIDSEPVYDSKSVTFINYTLLEEVNGVEVCRKDITPEVQSAGESYYAQYVKTFDVAWGDELAVYVIAEDSLGYIHKTLAYYWVESENGSVAETVNGGEMIFDKDGNLLYGDDILWS